MTTLGAATLVGGAALGSTDRPLGTRSVVAPFTEKLLYWMDPSASAAQCA